MPGPKYGTTRILDSDDGIALSDSGSIDLKEYCGYQTISSLIVSNIGNKRRSVLPYEFGFGGSTSGIIGYVWTGYSTTSMVDECL